ncbi:MAG: hypothetical protein BGO26_08835 [Actinobacteria bacterium 69-20]|nr:hypothetical protein [Actinomycetota bacterium]OJV25798.1 MAG: hypothetical protein BGO26_08835 [Actinobacteria bacterium 69-20]
MSARDLGRVAQMHTAGTASWRFAHDIDERLHVALYIRDALDLPTAAEGTPPRLASEIPDRSGLLGPEAARAVAAQWLSWWRDIVTAMASAQRGRPLDAADVDGRPRYSADWHRQMIDPPDWNSLADRPGLRGAAKALWTDSLHWFEPARRPYLPPSCTDVFRWEWVRDCAEGAAARHHVSPGAIDGCAEVLLVEGLWWQLVAPGVALCSIAAARDAAIAPAILDEIFDSYLAG